MTTIFTKFMPRTDTKPARVKAWTSTRGQGCYNDYAYGISPLDNHILTMHKLCDRLSLDYSHATRGPMPYGYVFILNNNELVTHAE